MLLCHWLIRYRRIEETSASDYPVWQRHIPDERNLQLHRCENVKTPQRFKYFTYE